MKLIMTKGLIASGKSTWAIKTVENSNGEIKRINNDDLRLMIDGSKWSREREKEISAVRELLIRYYLDSGYSVIVDNTNLHPKHETNYRRIADEYGIAFEVKFFEVSLHEAIRRDALRENPVGKKNIQRMYNQFLKPKAQPIVRDENLPMCIVADLDGTIALIGDRSPYDGKKCHVDIPNLPVIEVIKQFYNVGDTVFIFSGRNGESIEESKEWLKEHNVPYDFLVMRPIGDSRKDSDVKEEFYADWVEGAYNVRFVLDDRLQVCRLWHSLGLTLLRVGDPEADF